MSYLTYLTFLILAIFQFKLRVGKLRRHFRRQRRRRNVVAASSVRNPEDCRRTVRRGRRHRRRKRRNWKVGGNFCPKRLEIDLQFLESSRSWQNQFSELRSPWAFKFLIWSWYLSKGGLKRVKYQVPQKTSDQLSYSRKCASFWCFFMGWTIWS